MTETFAERLQPVMNSDIGALRLPSKVTLKAVAVRVKKHGPLFPQLDGSVVVGSSHTLSIVSINGTTNQEHKRIRRRLVILISLGQMLSIHIRRQVGT